MGIVVNRAGMGTSAVYDYCREKNIPCLAEIPYDRNIARAYSEGRIISELSPDLQRIFTELRDQCRAICRPTPAEEVCHV